MVLITAFNYFSVRLSGAIQILLTSLKIGAILIVISGGLFFAHPHPIEATPIPVPLSLGTLGALLTALVPAMSPLIIAPR